jgi:peptidoglycan/LPS O-acetylase OafA/YrhL
MDGFVRAATRSVAKRGDIDGLRALAVALVILFHLDYTFFQGGYVGVDVFFVISGFLITGIIVREVEQTGSFSFSRFYLRRCRRLLPAMLVTVAATFTAASFFFPPDMLAAVAGSSIASIFSVSNIFFWLHSGYFDTTSHMAPLLHTWSLSVEEQFYLVWPLAIMLCAKHLGRSGTFLAIILMFAASLTGVHRYSQYSSAIFFLSPFRVFEFAMGAALNFMPRLTMRKGASDTLFALGIASILLSAVTFSSTTPLRAALIPTVGAALVIFAGPTTRIRSILDNRALVPIGEISYSLYLVHWPLIVLYRYWTLSDFGHVERLWLLLATIVFGIALHFLIERPFRHPSVLITLPRTVPFLATLAILIATTTGVSYSAWSSLGWKWRYSKEALALIEGPGFQLPHPLNGCFMNHTMQRSDIAESCYAPSKDNRPHILVVGDSTANALVPGLQAVLKDQYDVKIWGSASCASLYEIKIYPDGTCELNNAEFYERLIEEYRYDLVIFSNNSAWKEVVENFAKSAALLKKANVKFVLVGQIPTYWTIPAHIVARYPGRDLREVMRDKQEVRCDAGEHGLDSATDDGLFFSIRDAICDGDYPIYEVDGNLMQADTLHLSDAGSLFVANKLVAFLRQKGLIGPVETHRPGDRESAQQALAFP